MTQLHQHDNNDMNSLPRAYSSTDIGLKINNLDQRKSETISKSNATTWMFYISIWRKTTQRWLLKVVKMMQSQHFLPNKEMLNRFHNKILEPKDMPSKVTSDESQHSQDDGRSSLDDVSRVSQSVSPEPSRSNQDTARRLLYHCFFTSSLPNIITEAWWTCNVVHFQLFSVARTCPRHPKFPDLFATHWCHAKRM
jgi:hypothetical protein